MNDREYRLRRLREELTKPRTIWPNPFETSGRPTKRELEREIGQLRDEQRVMQRTITALAESAVELLGMHLNVAKDSHLEPGDPGPPEHLT